MCSSSSSRHFAAAAAADDDDDADAIVTSRGDYVIRYWFAGIVEYGIIKRVATVGAEWRSEYSGVRRVKLTHAGPV